MTVTLLMAVVGSIGLSGGPSINVIERRREIGVIQPMGASSADVGKVFVGEGLLFGLVSGYSGHDSDDPDRAQAY